MYREPDTGKWLVFLTNNFELAASTIAALYKERWKVELFFKTLKQNLKIKKFLGTNENSVKSQIFVALIAYLLLQILRLSLKSEISIPDAMAVIGVMLLMKVSISNDKRCDTMSILPSFCLFSPERSSVKIVFGKMLEKSGSWPNSKPIRQSWRNLQPKQET